MAAGFGLIVTFEDIDLGFDATFRALRKSNNVRVEAGLFGRKMAQRGAIGEYGTKTGPLAGKGRPWLSVAADTGMNKIAKASQEAAMNITEGMDGRKAYEPVGETMAQLARDVITRQRVRGPKLSASWVKRKGHSRKMDGLNKGKRKMLNSITHKVTGGGRG